MVIGTLFEMRTAEYTVRVSRYSAHAHMPAHAHDHDGVSVVIDGALAEEAEHRAVTATSGWVVTKPRGVLHENRFGERGATILAVIPHGELARSLPRQWQWLESPATFQAALRLARPRSAHSHGDTDDRVIELVASLVPTERSRSPWLRRVKRALDDFAPLSVAQLAADAGVHPVYLARAFRASYGVSIRQYRQMAQARRALRLILGTNLSLAQVALECGFADHSHMCRTFRLVAGWSPSAIRR